MPAGNICVRTREDVVASLLKACPTTFQLNHKIASSLEKQLFEGHEDEAAYHQGLTQLLFSLAHPEFGYVPLDCISLYTKLSRFRDSEVLRKDTLMQRTPVRQQAEEGYMTCKCGSKRINWENVPSRSADEGSTLFCVCTECSAKWRISA